MSLGFCSIPVTKFYKQDDTELCLLENYLVKLKYYKHMKRKNDTDFGFLNSNLLKNNKSKSEAEEEKKQSK